LANVTNYNSNLILNIAGNDFATNAKAVNLSNSGCNFASRSPTVNVHSNNIESSNAIGVDFDTCVGNFDMSNNYWGTLGGPNGINLGTATGKLTYVPFSLLAF